MLLKALQVVIVFGVWGWFFTSAPHIITLVMGLLFGLAVASMVTAAIYWTGEALRLLRQRLLSRKPVQEGLHPGRTAYLIAHSHEPEAAGRDRSRDTH